MDRKTEPHLVALHGLLPGLHLAGEAHYIIAWYAKTTTGQALITVRVGAYWIFVASGRTDINKPASVDAAVCNASTSARMIPMNLAAPNECVKTPRML